MPNSISIGSAYEDQQLNGAVHGKRGGTASFYGRTPVIQRAYSSALHATSGISSSTDFGATQLAWAQEVQQTFIGLGIWATV